MLLLVLDIQPPSKSSHTFGQPMALSTMIFLRQILSILRLFGLLQTPLKYSSHKKCHAFAEEDGYPISEASTVRTAIVIMDATCVLTAKLPADCTLLSLYTHFHLAAKNQKREVTNQVAGYHYTAHT